MENGEEVEVANENVSATGTAVSQLSLDQVIGLVLFARDILNSASRGSLCQNDAYSTAILYSLIEANDEAGWLWADEIDGVVEAHDAFYRDHVPDEPIQSTATEQ